MHFVKRIIGKKWSECAPRLRRSLKQTVCKASDKDELAILVRTNRGEDIYMKPEQVSAIVLIELKRIAERHIGMKSVNKAVIAVPAYFTLT